MVDATPEDSPHGELTRQLRLWVDGEAAAREEVINQAYGQLKLLARQRLSRERDGHTLQPTALVHEAWLKMTHGEPVDWRDRIHFVAVAARAMRQILVDAGRRRSAVKRDASNLTTVQLQAEAESPQTVEILDLDGALIELEQLDSGQAKVVELRYFGGLTIEETAALLNLSVATVNRDWRAARAWLFLKLNESGS